MPAGSTTSGRHLARQCAVMRGGLSCCRPDPAVFRVYLGYAGWTQDQLRMEVELGAWFIFPAEASTVFNADPDSSSLEMIRKTELQLARSEPMNADSGIPAGQFADLRYEP